MSSHTKVVTTTQAPSAIGPYSQAIWVGDLLYCSGQVALDPASGTLIGNTVEEQTVQVMKNIAGLLESQGMNYGHIAKSLVFLRNMGDFAKFNETYAKHLKPPYPARSTVEVSGLPKNALVEIEVIAHRA